LAIVGKNLSLFCLAVVCENFASGMSAVALVALFMRIVDLRYTATQFSILTAFAFLPRTFSGPIAALGQSWLGWVGLYESVFLISLGFIPFLFMVYKSNYARELETLEISDVIDFNQSKQA
jgi:PAT family beta-lactamase induction signal transducer AmpG